MQLCFDATRFGLGLKEAVEFASGKGLSAVEFAFEPFPVATPATAKLSAQEKTYLGEVAALCKEGDVQVACIKLNCGLDVADKAAVKEFQQMLKKLMLVAAAVGCQRLSFHIIGGPDEQWLSKAAAAINPLGKAVAERGMKLLLSLSTPSHNRGLSLRQWRPLQPQEWRDLIAHCEGLALSFSAADCAWQNIDYLQILPGLVAAIEHVEANDVEVNRALLADSGLFGPLWWRYRRPGKGQIDWRQLIEALKLYDYQGAFSIQLDDEFVDDSADELENSLDESIKLLRPLLKY